MILSVTGSSSKSLAVGRINFLRAIKLRLPFSCQLPIGDHSQAQRLSSGSCHVAPSLATCQFSSWSKPGGAHPYDALLSFKPSTWWGQAHLGQPPFWLTHSQLISNLMTLVISHHTHWSTPHTRSYTVCVYWEAGVLETIVQFCLPQMSFDIS